MGESRWEDDEWQVHAGKYPNNEGRVLSGHTMARMMMPEMFRENQVKKELKDVLNKSTSDKCDRYELDEKIRESANRKYVTQHTKFVKGSINSSGLNVYNEKPRGVYEYSRPQDVSPGLAFEQDQERLRDIPTDFNNRKTLDSSAFHPIKKRHLPVRQMEDHYKKRVMEDYDYLVSGNISKYMRADEFRKHTFSGGKIKRSGAGYYTGHDVNQIAMDTGENKFQEDRLLLTSKIRRNQVGTHAKSKEYNLSTSFQNTQELDMGYLKEHEMYRIRDIYKADMNN